MVCWIAYSDGKRCRVSSFCCVCAQFCYTARIELLDDSDARYYPKQYSTHDIPRGCPVSGCRAAPTRMMQTPVECTVTSAAGNVILTAYPGTPVQFVADGQPVMLSADAAALLPVVAKMQQISSGAGAASLTGEPVKELNSASLTICHATWFDNATQSTIAVQPAAWKNEVMTCYLKSSIPVAFAGVTWLYGEPAMMEGYTFVIALQQVDASTILANLAYTLPQ